ncbi:Adenylate cyclase [Ruegeria denitrificans]|uniref:Adenylate cyclase n=1 Tax=Ruegeria denitrificans TaxID=1715692 RepID=A0A0P1IFM3_9RHOB|nr:adenylate/guanylate cyclase domain-containing protein [Ruegeria denitrificans]CUK10459.1 Adenylate cyclase [Ruegeria denitrificans]
MSEQPNILTRSVASIGLSVRSKLLIAFLGITCLLVGLALFGLNSLQQANNSTKSIIRNQERIEYFNQIHAYVGDLIVLTIGHYIPQSVVGRGQGTFFSIPVDDRVDDLLLFVNRGVRNFGQPGMPDAELIARLQAGLENVAPYAAETQRLREDEGKLVAAPYAMENLLEPLSAIQRDVYTVVQKIEWEMKASARSTAQAFLASRQNVLTAALMAVGMALLLGYSLSSSLIRPVRRIGQALGIVASGNFDARVAVPNRDELGELANNVNLTSERLGNLYGKVEAQRVELEAEHARSEALLYSLLPEDIAARLKVEPNGTIADKLPQVAILFADIVDFTPRAAKLPPVEVVAFLNKIFSAFDSLAEKHGLEKVKTIGDAYMVAAGMPNPCNDPMRRVAEMALDMQRTVAQMSLDFAEGLQIRIGLDAGPVVAGVIGNRKPFYDVWGDTVNSASRMESNGEPGRIQVTSEVMQELVDEYEFELRGTVAVKGMGEVETWWLNGKLMAG